MKLLITLLVPTLFVLYTARDYQIAEDYSVRFATKKAEGTFTGLDGTVRFDGTALEASLFDVWVETASIQTGNKTKDKHARGDSWLNAEEHPRIGFRSSAFSKTPTGYAVTGELSINGISKTATIPFTFDKQVFSGELIVNRQDYGIDGPFLFGGMVGDDVTVSLRIPVE